jgi:uncharacterized protein YegP (UPF0339 family)
MALALNKILIANTSSNTPGAYPQPVVISSIGTGNLTQMNAGTNSAQFIPAGLYIMPANVTANVIIEVNTYQNSTGNSVNNWVTYIFANNGGTIISDGYNVRGNAIQAVTSLTLLTVNGGNAVNASIFATT